MGKEIKFACPCMDKILKNLRKKLGTEQVYFTNTKKFMSLESSKVTVKPEPVRYEYTVFGIDKHPLKKMQKGYLHANFCQFCGKAFK